MYGMYGMYVIRSAVLEREREREIQINDESTVSFLFSFSLLTWLCQEMGSESEEQKRDELEMS